MQGYFVRAHVVPYSTSLARLLSLRTTSARAARAAVPCCVIVAIRLQSITSSDTFDLIREVSGRAPERERAHTFRYAKNNLKIRDTALSKKTDDPGLNTYYDPAAVALQPTSPLYPFPPPLPLHSFVLCACQSMAYPHF